MKKTLPTTVRVSQRSHNVLKQLSEREQITMVEALDRVTAEWERIQFFQKLNDSFAALRSDDDAWQSEVEERRLWDNTHNDDLNHAR